MTSPATPSDEKRSRLSPAMLAFLYALLAGLWIWLSDQLLRLFIDDPAQLARWETYKGWFFVAITALLLYLERMWSERKIRQVVTRLHVQMQDRVSELDRVRDQLQVIMDNAPVVFYIRDLEGRYRLVNQAWEQYTGIPRSRALGATPHQLFPKETAERIMAGHRAALKSNAPVVEEVVMPLQGSDHVFMRAHFTLNDKEGRPYAVAGILTNISERKAMEESLRASEARFRAIFDRAGIGIVLVGADRCIRQVNPAFQRMLNYPVEKLINVDFTHIIHPDDVAEAARLFQELLAGVRESYQVERRYLRADGELVWAHLTVSSLQETNGKEAFAIKLIEDITQRKAAAEALQQAHDMLERQVAERTAALRQAVDDLAQAQRVAHVGSWSLDLASGRLEWSDETYRIFGVTPGEFAGTRESFYAMVHPDDRELVRSKVAAAMEAHLPLDYEHRILRPDGSVCYVHERGIVAYDADGQPARLLGMVQDITDRKLADQALHAANERLATIVQASPAAIVAVDANWQITMWNPAAEQVFGWPASQAIGRSITSIFPAADRATEELRARVAAGETFTGLELKRRRLDGTLIDVAASIAPLRDAMGNVQGSVAVFSDITERKLAEAQIREWNQQLEAQVAERTAHLEQEIAERKRAQAEVLALNQTLAVQAQHLQVVNRELETFTYTVSHDLKAPLRGIDGYSRLLLEDYYDKLDEDGRFFLQTIRNATMQMARLIDDLLAYSRLERRPLATDQVNVDRLVETLIEQARHEQPDARVRIIQTTRCGAVTADADALTLALRNLLDNALKFSAKNDAPLIEIGGEAADDRCVLYVRDNGVGFDMQYHDRIFEIFQRLHRAEDYEGTGIGLAIVRKAIQRMGGQVWAESQPGQGATFYLEIPK
ncbi:MAG TPA: PAS domain S-box protein [Caldilineaceae bacterium]|nr:PAS domain S-box protein [Caldilineaceae bacterium]